MLIVICRCAVFRCHYYFRKNQRINCDKNQ